MEPRNKVYYGVYAGKQKEKEKKGKKNAYCVPKTNSHTLSIGTNHN